MNSKGNAGMDDAALITAFLEKRSEDAFRRLVQRHADMVYAACLRGLNGDIHAAEDATQSVFVVLTKRAKSIRNPAVLGGWLFRTARFVVAHMKREAARRRLREEKAAMDKQDGGTGKDEGQWDEVKPHLNDVLASLPAPQQKALVLHYLEGKTVREVANALASSENTIKKRIQYGLEKLRRRLSKKGVPVSAALITTCLSTKVIHAAPPGLAASCHTAAWQSLISGAVASSSSSLVIAKGAIKMMIWAKVKLVGTYVIAAAIVGVGTPVVMSVVAQDSSQPAKRQSTGDNGATGYGKLYDEFNKHCIDIFGAEKEPLVYRHFGEKLEMIENGTWKHISENSACIAWETNLPAKTYIEYGKTKKYDKKTPKPERHFSIHVHYVKGLETGKAYHYRLVSVDERGNKVVTKDATFKTKKIPGAVYVPGDMGEAPYVLDKANTTYVVKKDIIAQTKGFEIKASGVVLDLNGHTLTYDEGEPKIKVPTPKAKSGYTDKWAKYTYNEEATFGIRVNDKKLDNLKILNGIIIQGKTNSQGIIGLGFNPIYLKWPSTEIAGITAEYSGADLHGIVIDNGTKMYVHHNVVLDKGTHITNRHQAIRAITVPNGCTLHHNLVKRCRQLGICFGKNGEAYSNEVYVDSYCTNSYSLTNGNDSKVYANRLFGTGYHPIGLGIGYFNTKNRKYYDNYIQMQGTPPSERWREFGERNSAKGMRLQKGPTENTEFYNNTVVVKGRGGSRLRGLWMVPTKGAKNIVIRDNVVKVIAEDDKTVEAWAIAAQGESGVVAKDPILYKNNTIIANICHVRFGDEYSCGWAHIFANNKFIKAGNNPKYKTIMLGFWTKETFGNQFVDSELEGGADFANAEFIGSGARRDFSVGWTLIVKTAPGAKVTITDKIGKEVFAGVADAQGKVSAPLMQYIHKPDGKTDLTPHTVKVDKAGKTAEKQVTMDKEREVKL